MTSRGIVSALVDGSTGENPPAPPGFPSATFRANLYVHHPDGHIDWYALLPASFESGRTLSVGRDARCAIPIDDHAISGQHGELSAKGDALWFTDIGSTNGSAVDGEPIESSRPVRLDDGAVISVGNVDIRFQYSHRESPFRLALDFETGPLTGTRKETETASTTIGGADCDVTLTGAGVAGHHLRIDAYGPRQIYGVPLSPDLPTKLVGVPLPGVTALVPGAQLEVGSHRFAITVLQDRPRRRPTAPAPPLVDAAMQEARRQGQDPGTFDRRTIMDLSPLGAMVAKVLAGEMPPPPSAVRPPTRRDSGHATMIVDRSTLALDGPLELARRTGPLPRLEPEGAPWVRWITIVLVIAAIIAVAGLVPIEQRMTVEATLVTGPEVVVRAPVGGDLVEIGAAVGDTVDARTPLARLTDAAIASELDRVSARIGSLRVYSADKKVTRSMVRAARAEAAEARTQLEARKAQFAQGQSDLPGLISARSRHHERRGRLEALEARRADRRAGRDSAADLGREVQRRLTLNDRLVVSLDAATRCRVIAGPEMGPGQAVEAGAALFRLAPLDPLTASIAAPPAAIRAGLEATGGQVVATTDEGPRTMRFAADANEVWFARVSDPAGRLAPGQTIEVTIEPPPINAFTWLARRVAD